MLAISTTLNMYVVTACMTQSSPEPGWRSSVRPSMQSKANSPLKDDRHDGRTGRGRVTLHAVAEQGRSRWKQWGVRARMLIVSTP